MKIFCNGKYAVFPRVYACFKPPERFSTNLSFQLFTFDIYVDYNTYVRQRNTNPDATKMKTLNEQRQAAYDAGNKTEVQRLNVSICNEPAKPARSIMEIFAAKLEKKQAAKK